MNGVSSKTCVPKQAEAPSDPRPLYCRKHPRYRRGCRTCRVFSSWYQRSRRQPIAEWRRPAAPVAAHIRHLLDQGMSFEQIATAAGLSITSVKDSYYGRGRQDWVLPQTFAAVLAVQVPAPDQLRRIISGIGVQRRLQAMARDGRSSAYIAGRLGLPERSVREWRHNGGGVRACHAAAIGELYDELTGMPGGDAKTITWAIKYGYLPARLWPAHQIDNPRWDPLAILRRPDGVRRRLQALAYMGHPPADVGALIGEDADTVDGWIREAPVPAYAHHLVDRVYDLLGSTLGPDAKLRAHARVCGWASAMAWHGRDIDNPAARPRHNAAPPPRTEVNPDRINGALIGAVPACELTSAERVEVVQRLHLRNWSDREIGQHLRWSDTPQRSADAVLAFRTSHGIARTTWRPRSPALQAA